MPNWGKGSGCLLARDVKAREVEEEEFLKEHLKGACCPQISVSCSLKRASTGETDQARMQGYP